MCHMTFKYSVPDPDPKKTDSRLIIECTDVSLDVNWKPEYEYDDAKLVWSGTGAKQIVGTCAQREPYPDPQTFPDRLYVDGLDATLSWKRAQLKWE